MEHWQAGKPSGRLAYPPAGERCAAVSVLGLGVGVFPRAGCGSWAGTFSTHLKASGSSFGSAVWLGGPCRCCLSALTAPSQRLGAPTPPLSRPAHRHPHPHTSSCQQILHAITARAWRHLHELNPNTLANLLYGFGLLTFHPGEYRPSAVALGGGRGRAGLAGVAWHGVAGVGGYNSSLPYKCTGRLYGAFRSLGSPLQPPPFLLPYRPGLSRWPIGTLA